MNEWQPIQTAPRDGTLVLVYVCDEFLGHITRIAKYSPTYDVWEYGRGEYEFLSPTHWMPLPDPPKEAA